MYIDSDAWVACAKERRSRRDKARESFYADGGVEKGGEPQDMRGAPQKQRLLVVQLLNLTRKGDLEAGHKAMCSLLAAALQTAGLGKGVMGATAETQADLSAHEMTELRSSFFLSPAFFDEDA